MFDFRTKKNIEILVFMASIFCMSLILFFIKYSEWNEPNKILSFVGELTLIPTILLTLFLLGFSIFKLVKAKTFNIYLSMSLVINIITTFLIFSTK